MDCLKTLSINIGKVPNLLRNAGLWVLNILRQLLKKFREAIHLNASMLLSGDFSFFSKSEYKPLVLLAFPVGLLLYFYIRFTSKSSLNPKLNKE